MSAPPFRNIYIWADFSAVSEPEVADRALRRTYPDGADRPRLVISSDGKTRLVYVINSNIRLGGNRGRDGLDDLNY